MKLLVRKYTDGDIISVENITKYTQRDNKPVTEEKIYAQVAEQNAKNNGVQFHIVELPEDDSLLYQVVQMLMGEKQYKRTFDIEDLCDSINEFKNQLETIQSDVYDMISPIESIAEKSREIVDKIEAEL